MVHHHRVGWLKKHGVTQLGAKSERPTHLKAMPEQPADLAEYNGTVGIMARLNSNLDILESAHVTNLRKAP